MNSRPERGDGMPPRTVVFRFLRMTLVFIPVVLCITLAVFLYTERTIEMEFSSTNLSDTRLAAEGMAKLTRNMRLMTASLLLDENARAFFSDSDVFEGTKRALNGQIMAYLNTYDGVESIYLYAPVTGQILTGLTCYTRVTAMSNVRWLNYVQQADEMLLFPRIQEDGYPYVLTAMRRLDDYGYEGVAVVNLSLKSIGSMLGVQEDDAHLFYILDEEGSVLYRKNKQALLEEAEAFDDLRHFEQNAAEKTLLDRSEGRAFVWSQVRDESTGLYFVEKTYMAEYTERVNILHGVIFSGAMILAVLFLGVAAFLTYHALQPLKQLERVLDQGEAGLSKSRQDEYTRYLTRRIMGQIQTNEHFREMLTDQLILLEKTQLRSLRSQINPHFLFNSLNAVSMQVALGEEGKDRAIRMIGWLSELLRYSLAKTDAVTLSVEIQQTRHYISLLEARYDQEFTVELCVAPGLETRPVPRLFLQPLIENAVFHGVAPLEGRPGVIRIDIAPQDGALSVSVSDNGIGMTRETLEDLRDRLTNLPAELPEKHIGLLNVAIRLHLMYPDAPPIGVESEPGVYTRFTLLIPPAGSAVCPPLPTDQETSPEAAD